MVREFLHSCLVSIDFPKNFFGIECFMLLINILLSLLLFGGVYMCVTIDCCSRWESVDLKKTAV